MIHRMLLKVFSEQADTFSFGYQACSRTIGTWMQASFSAVMEDRNLLLCDCSLIVDA